MYTYWSGLVCLFIWLSLRFLCSSPPLWRRYMPFKKSTARDNAFELSILNLPGSHRLFSSYFVKISADISSERTPLCLNCPNTLSTALCDGWNLGSWTSMKLGAFSSRVWQCRSRPVSRLYNIFGRHLCPSCFLVSAMYSISHLQRTAVAEVSVVSRMSSGMHFPESPAKRLFPPGFTH